MRRERGKRPVEALVAAEELPANRIAVQQLQLEDAQAQQETIVAQTEQDAAVEEAMPVVVAFAAFDPPPSSDTQMLSLQPGDEIVALGQDGQGWWYGRKADGVEGWFPPSYVQVKDDGNAGAAGEAAPT